MTWSVQYGCYTIPIQETLDHPLMACSAAWNAAGISKSMQLWLTANSAVASPPFFFICWVKTHQIWGQDRRATAGHGKPLTTLLHLCKHPDENDEVADPRCKKIRSQRSCSSTHKIAAFCCGGSWDNWARADRRSIVALGSCFASWSYSNKSLRWLFLEAMKRNEPWLCHMIEKTCLRPSTNERLMMQVYNTKFRSSMLACCKLLSSQPFSWVRWACLEFLFGDLWLGFGHQSQLLSELIPPEKMNPSDSSTCGVSPANSAQLGHSSRSFQSNPSAWRWHGMPWLIAVNGWQHLLLIKPRSRSKSNTPGSTFQTLPLTLPASRTSFKEKPLANCAHLAHFSLVSGGNLGTSYSTLEWLIQLIRQAAGPSAEVLKRHTWAVIPNSAARNSWTQ